MCFDDVALYIPNNNEELPSLTSLTGKESKICAIVGFKNFEFKTDRKTITRNANELGYRLFVRSESGDLNAILPNDVCRYIIFTCATSSAL